MIRKVATILFFIVFQFYLFSESIKPDEVFRDFSLSGKCLLDKFSDEALITFREGASDKQRYKIYVTPKRVIFSGHFFYQEKINTLALGKEFSFQIIADGIEVTIFINGQKFFQVKDGISRQGEISFSESKQVVFSDLKIKKIANGMKTVALSTRQALKTFILPNKLQIKVIADESLIQNPVMMKFDAKGRLWVVEMSGYMRKSSKGILDVPGGHIALLTDENQDGVFDKRVTFIENSPLPRAIEYVDNGILYADEENLYFVEENDGVKGKSEIVDTKYSGTKNPEKDSNGLLRGIDNWIYSANSSFRYRRVNGKWLKGSTIRRGQWGISQDNYGRLLYTTNSAPFIGDIILPGFAISSKNDFTKFVGDKFYSRFGQIRKVFPIIDTYVNRGYLDGNLDYKGRLVKATSISTGEVYGGTNLPERYHNSFIVTEPAGHLIKALKFSANSKGFLTQNLFDKNEFLQSYDRLFRPVDIRTSPNGSLAFVDFYRGLIQHNIYLTDYLRDLTVKNSLDDVMDLGRIYQIYDPSRPFDKVEDLTKKDTKDLVKLLGHRNRWWRQKAQGLIVNRQERSKMIKEQLIKQFLETKDEICRLHTLWSLEGLGHLSEELVVRFFNVVNTQWLKNHLFHSLRSYDILKNKNLFSLIQESLAKDKGHNQVYALQLLDKFSLLEAKGLFIKTARKLKKNKPFLSILFLNSSPTELLAKYKLDWDIYFPKPKENNVSFSAKKKVILRKGKKLFGQCRACHGGYGQGIPGLAPVLAKSDWVQGSKNKLISVVMKGLSGPIKVNGKEFSGGVMPNFEKIYNDEQMANILSFLRNNFGNQASFVTAEDVKKVRMQLKDIKNNFTEESLNEIYTK